MDTDMQDAGALKAQITYDDFAKLDIRIGTVVAAEMVPDADKLIKCTLDFGPLGQRTIVSGIAMHIAPETLLGRQLPYVVNLAPRTLKGVVSEGMLVAGEDDQGLVLISPVRAAAPGTHLS